MNYQYLAQITTTADIEIGNIGNTCIQAFNDVADEYYLYLHTDLGRTTIIEYGPIVADMEELPDFCICNYSVIDYNEKKIDKIIDKFLNNPTRKITQAQEISAEHFKECVKDIKRYIK